LELWADDIDEQRGRLVGSVRWLQMCLHPSEDGEATEQRLLECIDATIGCLLVEADGHLLCRDEFA
tara:strand:+ start:812 stop:1009 length:198 start_codon:yes stop_codon:yes gene_type:complete